MSLRDHFVRDPPSADIAARLEAEGATVCEHKLNPCTLFCGVRCVVAVLDPLVRREVVDGVETVHWEQQLRKVGSWEVETLEERVAWLEQVEENIRRNAEKQRG